MADHSSGVGNGVSCQEIVRPLTLTLTSTLPQLPQLLYPCSDTYCQTRRLLLTSALTLTLTLTLTLILTLILTLTLTHVKGG